jgi:hypothetical protein
MGIWSNISSGDAVGQFSRDIERIPPSVLFARVLFDYQLTACLGYREWKGERWSKRATSTAAERGKAKDQTNIQMLSMADDISSTGHGIQSSRPATPLKTGLSEEMTRDEFINASFKLAAKRRTDSGL